jgi:hypothetical protein
MFGFFDPLYLLFALPGLVLGLWAQWKVKSTFEKYAQVPTSGGSFGRDALGRMGYSGGITGTDVLRRLMRQTGVTVGVGQVPGYLTDHYDPRTKTIALSESSQENSVAGVAVVAHEFGHAMQDAQNYGPLKLRGAIVPAIQLSQWVGPLLFIAGMLLQSSTLALFGIIAFSLMAVFSIVTLPVEFDASRRALVLLRDGNILQGEELGNAKKVLDAAALTYVAAAVQSIGTLLYYVMMFSGLRRREE